MLFDSQGVARSGPLPPRMKALDQDSGTAPLIPDMAAKHKKRARDQRLDFFRGLTMFIIFISHVPGNPWSGWIPAAFGFSSGAELFVFCSGVASAMAFGTVFVKRGWWLGTARIAYRIWQVYWAHISLLVVSIAVAAAADRWARSDFITEQFAYLTKDPADALLGAVILRWLPPLLDILPLYIVVLSLIPVMMGLRSVHRWLPVGLSLGLYVLVWTLRINVIGDPSTGGLWNFNPFAWQLVFFIGFALRSGWVPTPAFNDRRLMTLSVGFIALSVPINFWGIRNGSGTIEAIYNAILPSNERTDLHALRVVHFLALAYVVLSLIDPWKDKLNRGLGRIIVMVGRYSLATFLTSIILARIGSVMLQLRGPSTATIVGINLGGFVGIIGIAAVVRWFKSAPWAS